MLTFKFKNPGFSINAMAEKNVINLSSDEQPSQALDLIPDEGFLEEIKEDSTKIFLCKSCGKGFCKEITVRKHIKKDHKGKKRGNSGETSEQIRKKTKDPEENDKTLDNTKDFVGDYIESGKAIYRDTTLTEDDDEELGGALHSTLNETLYETLPPNQEH